MDRLTTYKTECNREMVCRYEDCDICEEYCPHLQEDNCLCLQGVLEKLGQYEDAEEQGLLYRMPCKAKQIVYILDPNLCQRIHRPFKCEVDEFVIDGKSCFAVLNGCEHYYAMRRFKAVNIDNFGKTVFLTREEAEQALATMKGGAEC